MSGAHPLHYNSEVGLLDTRPQEQADIVYPRCCPIHPHIPCSHLSVLLKYISQLFHSHPNVPSLVKNSAQGFQTPLPLVTAGLLNGQRISLLQSTTRILCGALSCRRMKRLLFPHHHHYHHHALPPRMSVTLKQDIVF